MKKFDNYFKHDEENKHFIDEFIQVYNSPEYKTIGKKVKHSYKKDLCKWLYYFNVYRITEENAPKVKDIDKRGLMFHLDHIIPIEFGYKYDIDYSVIGSLENLQMLSLKDNFLKGNILTKQAKEVLSLFQIKESDLLQIERPLITHIKKDVHTVTETAVNSIEINNKRLTLYPNPKGWLNNHYQQDTKKTELN